MAVVVHHRKSCKLRLRPCRYLTSARLPAFEDRSWYVVFTEEERQLAMERIERDRVSNKESDHSIMYGLKLAAKDYRVWVFVRHRSSKELIIVSKRLMMLLVHHALLQPLRLRLQQLLPKHRTRLQSGLQHHHARLHRTALPRRRSHHFRHGVQQRSTRRAWLAYHHIDERGNHRIHHFGCDPQRSR
jgi:hypothetical protein